MYKEKLIDKLEHLSTINIKEVCVEELKDIEEVKFSNDLSKDEKCMEFMLQLGNPFMYQYKGRKVKTVFVGSDKTFNDCIKNIIQAKVEHMSSR